MVANQLVETVRGYGRLVSRGIVDPTAPVETLRTMRELRQFTPQASLIRHAARVAPDAPGLIDERGTLTYRDLDKQSSALARGLRARGIGTGDVVGILARDHRGLILSMVASGKLGARIALMNTGFAKPQFTEVCQRENVRVMLYDSEFSKLLDMLPDTMPRLLTWVDPYHEVGFDYTTIDDLIARYPTQDLPTPTKPGGFTILTSGTTGLPKGASRARTSPMSTAQFVDRIPFPRRGTSVIVSPVFHSTGLSTWLVNTALQNTVVLGRRFDPENTLRMVAEHRAEQLVLVPTMLHRITQLPPVVLAKYDTSSLRAIVLAGSALAPELCQRATEIFGPVLYNLYGSTEVAVASVATPEDLALAPGTVGRAPVTCDIRLYDDEDRLITDTGVTGRIFVRSGAPFEGYTDGNSKPVIDGYLSSGDLGHIDSHGLLMVDGRDDDMIVSGGENVFPQEVENLLLSCPTIQDVGVVGVPDTEFGTRLRAFVVAEPGHRPTVEEIKDLVRANLARYKVPRDVFFLDNLPRNATGKLLRRVLTDAEDAFRQPPTAATI